MDRTPEGGAGIAPIGDVIEWAQQAIVEVDSRYTDKASPTAQQSSRDGWPRSSEDELAALNRDNSANDEWEALARQIGAKAGLTNAYEARALRNLMAIGIKSGDTRFPALFLIETSAEEYLAIAARFGMSLSLQQARNIALTEMGATTGIAHPLSDEDRRLGTPLIAERIKERCRDGKSPVTDDMAYKLAIATIRQGEHGPTAMQKVGSASGCFGIAVVAAALAFWTAILS